MGQPIPPPLPKFEVRLSAPVISDWVPGNTGIPGFTTRESGKPGPHVAVLALAHGNEIAGAIVLDRLLRAGARTRIELERLEARVPLTPRDGGRRSDAAWRDR